MPLTKTEDYYTAFYKKSRAEFFDIPADETQFFSDSDRIRMVAHALEKSDINRLVAKHVCVDYYPLHDGRYDEASNTNDQEKHPGLRFYLHQNWARWKNVFKLQPLEEIKVYFGEKVALYFAFIGFYTNWLIPFALVGLIVMVYGVATYDTDTYVNDTCNLSYVMCPSCDDCEFQSLSSSLCFPTKITYIFDNALTPMYAFLVSIWATVFLKFWNRRNIELAYAWDLAKLDIDQMPVRAQYKAGFEFEIFLKDYSTVVLIFIPT